MPSRLFDEAVASMESDERRAFEQFERRLAKTMVPPGDRLVENLRSESHLVGDGDFGESAELSSFLRTCGAKHDPSAEAAACYEATCRGHELRGLGIPLDHLPPRLLRYSRSRTLAGKMIEKILGKRARGDFDNDLFVEDTLAELAAAWYPGALVDSQLGAEGTALVFATFEHTASAPRDDPRALTQALALNFWGSPRTRDELVIELSYPTRSITNTRFPTVADVGLSHLFRPAPEVPPSAGKKNTWYGWTEPLGGQPPQPELVHANAPVSVLDRSPRFVGRVPL
jgi:hypothetical protein